MKFARLAAPRKACACCGSMPTTPSPPPPSSGKKTKKKRSKCAYDGAESNSSFPFDRFRGTSDRIIPLMKIARRVFAFLLVLSAAAATRLPAQTAEKTSAKKNYLAFVGTYTTKTASKGIYVFRYDATSGKLTPIGVAAETPDPSWVAIHPGGKYLYAVNEAGKNSMVSAFALDAKTGKLTLLNQLPALGEDPCYISFDQSGKYVLIANYTSGNVVVFPIGPDGQLGAATANVLDEGRL